MQLLVDGQAGNVTLTPSRSDEESFAKRKREFEELDVSPADEAEMPCTTQDGVEISLLANIGLPGEI
ncbi:hypothetical protein OAS39_04005 [Pirellulales bacterium]|nr:hypothetical protein [Pirellulales bacterium]